MKSWSTSGGNVIYKVLSGRSNVFLLTNGLISILVDSGPEFMWNTLQKRLDRLRINHIHYLVLTHSHFDHSGNASRIKEKYKAQIIIHRSEADYLAAGDNILPVGTNPLTRLIVRAFANKFRSFALYQPCISFTAIDDQYDFSGSGISAYLLHTPGHTAGSVCLIADDETALVGDTMFGVFPWTIFPPFASDQNLLLNSWKRLLETKCRLFLPSHGSAIARDRAEKDFSRRIRRKQIIQPMRHSRL